MLLAIVSCIVISHISSVIPPPGSSPPRPLLATFWPFSVTLDSFLQCDGCHIMTLLLSFLLFLPIPAYSVM